MNLKRITFAWIAAVLFLACARPAPAARIYNRLPIPVQINSANGYLKLQPGQKSDSLSWERATSIRIDSMPAGQAPMCQLSFGLRREMVGGHYLIIGNNGREVVCTLCDADYHQMYQVRSLAPREVMMELNRTSSKTGC
jgi:hypothetical protein